MNKFDKFNSHLLRSTLSFSVGVACALYGTYQAQCALGELLKINKEPS